jgi:hypothetical protein
MKCFERLVMAHINSILPETLDPLQLAYRPNRSTDDAISIALYTALSHLDKRNTYVRMLFISSAFNTIVPSKLITKLRTLGLNTSLCNWILDFLKGRPQVVPQGQVRTHPERLSSTHGHLRGACSVPSCTPCSLMAARPGTIPKPSLSWPMTQQ